MYPYKGHKKRTASAEAKICKFDKSTFFEIMTKPIRNPIQPPRTQPCANISFLLSASAPKAIKKPEASTKRKLGKSKKYSILLNITTVNII